MCLNKLSGEGLFDERPSTQTRLGRFVLGLTKKLAPQKIKAPTASLLMLRRILLVLSLLGAAHSIAFGGPGGTVNPRDTGGIDADNGAPLKSPAFSDTFSGGTLDSAKWFIDTGTAPGNIAGINSGTLSAEHVDLSTGMLRLTLKQSVSGVHATSVGAEIRSKRLVGYGTYVWVARAASTSVTPRGRGSAVSGTVTDVFNFINDSESEIDFEYQGQSPSTLEMTNFSTVSKSQSTSVPVSDAHSSFHEYKYIWSAAKIEFYVNGTLVSTHTEHIPSAPAAVLMNLWGTNSTSFGGVATDGVTRYLYVSLFSYTPLP
jgi:beta-glucanase (GH16 family)